MVFVVDVGNTNIVIGGFDTPLENTEPNLCQLNFMARIATDCAKTDDQYAIEFINVLKLYGHETADFEGSIISTVVPPLLSVLKMALKKMFKISPIIVSAGVKTGLNIKIDNPGILGSDLVCSAVGALKKYTKPIVIIDLGTATKFTALDKSGGLLGGSIMPGIKISLDALSRSTAQLPRINLEFNGESVIGTNTVDCMSAGVLLGSASMIDGMMERYREVLGDKTTFVATGGLASFVIPHCKNTDSIIYDEHLLLEGLYIIYMRNIGR